jgi:hypothetical protein
MYVMPTISYIKIYGPPIIKAIRELEKIAVNMPEVCIMDTILASTPDPTLYRTDPGYTAQYFQAIPIDIKVKRCSNIISKSGEKLGEYDFFFEWFTKPSMDQMNQLIEKVDKVLTPIGCMYTITTKK